VDRVNQVCPTCQGGKFKLRMVKDADGKERVEMTNCPQCNGSGWVPGGSR